jgi:hypothetical protein
MTDNLKTTLNNLIVPLPKNNLLANILNEANHTQQQQTFFWRKPVLVAASVMLLVTGTALLNHQQSTANNWQYVGSGNPDLYSMPSTESLDSEYLQDLFGIMET